MVGADRVIVISHEVWQQQFAGDSVIGRQLTLPYTQWRYRIVGVAPAGLGFPQGTDFWISNQDADTLNDWDAIARLAPETTLAAARAEFWTIMRRIDRERAWRRNTNLPPLDQAQVTTFELAVVGDVRPALRVLMGAVTLLVIIACVNVGNLFLLRVSARSHEIAVRRSLGAEIGDIARQQLTETSMLVLTAGALGFLCAWGLIRVLLVFAPPGLPQTDVIRASDIPFGVAAAATALVLILVSSVPILALARRDVMSLLRPDARSGHESILQGRGFVEADREKALQVAVVSEGMARVLWPGKDPLGERIRLAGDTSAIAWRTVVGAAGDIRIRTLRDTPRTVYLPWRQTWAGLRMVAVRTTGAPGDIVPAMRRALREVDPSADIARVQKMDDYLGRQRALPQLSTLPLSGFGAVALLLAAIGLFGVMASSIRERTREMGVRAALGATPGRLRQDVLGQAMIVLGLGAIVGLAIALATSRLLASLLFEVSPTDPVALLGACIVLLGVGLLAAYVPARRATKIDPAVVLRAE
ncbi:MAG: ABC transporter permease [Gemmatimonadetes bacterium]|nr:ABC transporter permease [Gemmatimonadota bacterium]